MWLTRACAGARAGTQAADQVQPRATSMHVACMMQAGGHVGKVAAHPLHERQRLLGVRVAQQLVLRRRKEGARHRDVDRRLLLVARDHPHLRLSTHSWLCQPRSQCFISSKSITTLANMRIVSHYATRASNQLFCIAGADLDGGLEQGRDGLWHLCLQLVFHSGDADEVQLLLQAVQALQASACFAPVQTGCHASAVDDCKSGTARAHSGSVLGMPHCKPFANSYQRSIADKPQPQPNEFNPCRRSLESFFISEGRGHQGTTTTQRCHWHWHWRTASMPCIRPKPQTNATTSSMLPGRALSMEDKLAQNITKAGFGTRTGSGAHRVDERHCRDHQAHEQQQRTADTSDAANAARAHRVDESLAVREVVVRRPEAALPLQELRLRHLPRRDDQRAQALRREVVQVALRGIGAQWVKAYVCTCLWEARSTEGQRACVQRGDVYLPCMKHATGLMMASEGRKGGSAHSLSPKRRGIDTPALLLPQTQHVNCQHSRLAPLVVRAGPPFSFTEYAGGLLGWQLATCVHPEAANSMSFPGGAPARGGAAQHPCPPAAAAAS